MNSITRFTLAVLVMMMTAVVPQSMQAQSSERSIPPGISMNRAMMQGGTNLPASGINASPSLGLMGEKIVTKAPSSTPIVYIGESPLTIPTVADGKMYYTYSDANGLGTGSKDSYNVAVSKAEDGTLNLTFNDLKVEKNHQFLINTNQGVTSAVYINYSGKTILTLEGESSLTGVDNTSIDYSTGLGSEGDIEIQGSGKLTATGGKGHIQCEGIQASDLTIALNGGSLTSTGGYAAYSFGLAAEKMFIKGNGTIIAEGGKARGNSYGIVASDLTIALDGGSLTSTGGEVELYNSYGLYASNQMSIKGNGTIIAEGGNAYGYSNGINTSDLTINLNGGSLTSIGGEATVNNSFGLAASNQMSIKGSGTIIAEGGKAHAYCEGIYASDLTIALNGGSLTASGGEAGYRSVGFCSPNAVKISSGVVIVQGLSVATVDKWGDPLAPSIYPDAIVTASTKYDGSNAGVYDPSKIAEYKYLHIENPDLKDASIDAIPNQAFTGYAITPKPVVKYGDRKLVEGKDYTVSYVNNVDPGTATITITGIGNFIGSRTISFTINPEPTTDNAYVNLPFVTGISTNPIAGTYSVTKGESFTFTITLKEGYEESKPIVTANRKEIAPNEAGEYVIEKITENVDITITGISATGVEGVSAKTAIWTNGHALNIRTARPQQLQVISILGKSAIARNIPAGDTSIGTLNAGIYVVRLADGTMEKVIIR